MTTLKGEFERFDRIHREAVAAYRRISQEPEFILEGALAESGKYATIPTLEYQIYLRNNTGFGEPWRKHVYTATNAVYGRIHKEADFMLGDSDNTAIAREARKEVVARGFPMNARIHPKYLDDFCGAVTPLRANK